MKQTSFESAHQSLEDVAHLAPPVDFGSPPEQLHHWRAHLDHYKHPTLLFDATPWPIVLNETLQKLVLDRSPISGGAETVAQLWKAVCEAAGHAVALHCASGKKSEVTTFFRVHHRCFVAMGSLLRTPSGRISGSVINLAEFRANHQPDNPTPLAESLPNGANQRTTDAVDEFQYWLTRRQVAREKIAVLTARESQVLALVANGHMNKEIAKMLGISVKTIEKHRSNAAYKLGAGSSAELVRISVFAGHDASSSLIPSG